MNVVGLVGMWRGERRHGRRDFTEDQFQALLSHPPGGPVCLCWSGEEFPVEDRDGVCLVGRKSNFGWSYGAWCHAALMYPDADAFILWEDDYAPCLDGWWERLVELFGPGDYWASLVWNVNAHGHHAALSHGIIDGAVLRGMAGEYLKLDLADADAQVRFSRMTEEHGAKLRPLQNEYAATYVNEKREHYYYVGDTRHVRDVSEVGLGSPLLFRSLWL